MWPAVPTTTCFIASQADEDGRQRGNLVGLDRAAVEEEAILGEAPENGRTSGAERVVQVAGGPRRRAERQGRRRQLDGGERASADLGARFHDGGPERAGRVLGQTAQELPRPPRDRAGRLNEH